MADLARSSVVSLLWFVFSWSLAAVAGAAILIALYLVKSAPLIVSSGLADAYAFLALEISDHGALSSAAFLTALIPGTAFGLFGMHRILAHDTNPFVMLRDWVRIRTSA